MDKSSSQGKWTETQINNARICSAHFTTATYDNSFSKATYKFFQVMRCI